MPARTSRRPAQRPNWPPRPSGSLRSSSTCRLLERLVGQHLGQAEHPSGVGNRPSSPAWASGELFLPSFPAGGDGQNASCYGNTILPAPAASACSDSSPGEGNYFDDTKLVIASEFTGNCNPHFRTSTSFLGVLHIEHLLSIPKQAIGLISPRTFCLRASHE